MMGEREHVNVQWPNPWVTCRDSLAVCPALECDLGEKQRLCPAVCWLSCLLSNLTQARNQGCIPQFSGSLSRPCHLVTIILSLKSLSIGGFVDHGSTDVSLNGEYG